MAVFILRSRYGVQITAGSHCGDGTVSRGSDHLADLLAAAIACHKQAGSLGQAAFIRIEVALSIQPGQRGKRLIFRLQTHG